MANDFDEQPLVDLGSADDCGQPHAESCADCTGTAAETSEIVGALRDASVWEPEPRSAQPQNQRIAELLRFRERLSSEDAAATEEVDRILQQPSAWWRAGLKKSAYGRTAGMARQLLVRMRDLIERAPADALVVTTIAAEIAESLSVAEYASDFVVSLRAQALRDHAYVLSFLGRFHEALRFAERAEHLFRQTPVPDYELARLDLVRSSIYRNIDRSDDALALAARAADTFLRFGDLKRYVDARIYEGATHFQRRDYQAALKAWQSIENHASLAGDAARVGVVHNLGICHRELGRLDEAARYLSAAAAEFELLGYHPSRVKSQWALASTVVAAGRYSDAIPMLRAAWREFESLEMEADAALVALELAEVLLITNCRDQVPAICRTLLDRFTRAGMGERAITALAFLRETVASGHATPAHVRHVHDFLRDVPAEGERLFARPPLGSLEG